MSRMTPWLVPLAAFACAAVQAAPTDDSHAMWVFDDTVAPAQQQAYETGIKAYMRCFEQHGLKTSITALLHVTGNTNEYSYVTQSAPWADFDEWESESSPCDAVERLDVKPYLTTTGAVLLLPRPQYSHMPSDDALRTGLLDVTALKLKIGYKLREAFTNALESIAAAANKADWEEHYTFYEVTDGGADAPDFFVVSSAKNWAEVGRMMNAQSLWKMVAGVYGEKKADALHDAVTAAIASESDHYDRYDPDLSYTPASH